MLGRLLFFIALLVLLTGILLTSDVCKHYRELLMEAMPVGIKMSLNHAASMLISSVGFLGGHSAGGIIFTKDELALYDGKKSSRIYLSITGKVFDVTKGGKHYGPGGGYSFFTGLDGTRAFVSGKFEGEGLKEDVTGLPLSDILSIEEWVTFYERQYKYIGTLIGLYYDKEGKPTDYRLDYEKKVKEAGQEKKMKKEDMKQFPPCNSEWSQGSDKIRLWCSTLSGGYKRKWEGVPRKYFRNPGESPRCACVKNTGPPSDKPDMKEHNNRGDLDNPKMQQYPDCPPDSVACYLPKDG